MNKAEVMSTLQTLQKRIDVAVAPFHMVDSEAEALSAVLAFLQTGMPDDFESAALPRIVHVLRNGWSLCTSGDVREQLPKYWPAGHVWVSASNKEDLSKATCPGCKAAAVPCTWCGDIGCIPQSHANWTPTHG